MKKTHLLMATALLSLTVLADTWTDPSTGITWTYIVRDGSAEVGKGAWTAAVSPAVTGAITIPAKLGGYPVTRIGGYAFYDCGELTSVTISDGVVSIGDGAFYYCRKLTAVTLPENLTVIGAAAFHDCGGLKSVTIPSGVRSIENTTFSGCNELSNVIIPEGVTNIGVQAFSRCSGLTSMTIPSSVTSIGKEAFWACSGLKTLTIREGVESIGDGAFGGCRGLHSVSIPNGVRNIGHGAFSNCTGLESVIIPPSVTSVGYDAFACTKLLDEHADGLVIVDDCLIKYKGTCADSVTIPDGVRVISDDAFSGCSDLESVVIPPSVKSIGYFAFRGCSGLADEDGFVIINGVLYGYFGAATSVVIPSGVTAIGGYAFETRTGSISVTVPEGMTSIGISAFSGCSGLRSVTIPSSVTNIGYMAFYDTGLTSVTIPEGVMRVEEWAFGHSGLYSVTIPLSMTRIEACVFEGCSYLTSVEIPSSITSIGDGAFELCRELKTVSIPQNVTSIGAMAFNGCRGLMELVIGTAVPPRIGAAVFDACDALTTIYVPYGTMAAYVEDSAWHDYAAKFKEMVPIFTLSVEWSSMEGFVYDGNGKMPAAVVKDGDLVLVKDVNYAICYEGNTNAGIAKAILTGIFPYVGSVTNLFTINPKPLTVTADAKTQVYGETLKPLTYTTVGLISGDALMGALTREPGEGAGEYDILLGTLANGNYTISYTGAKYTITKGTIPGGGEEPGVGEIPEGGLSKFDAVRVYNGKGQTIDVEKLEEAFSEVVGDDFTISFAMGEGGGLGQPATPWSAVAPTITDIGELVMWYRVTSPNYEDYVHQAKVTVVEKVITDEMVQPGEDAFFWDGNDKKPTVDVVYEVDGKDICTENDYTLAYGMKAAAGWWVTVTGKGNYSGTVTKIVPVLKRPVAPPVITPKSYNGKTQKPTIPTDSRWTVVANPGGINVGEYSNVVLRLTNTTDYKWKGGAEDQMDITLVFRITRASNRWRTSPDMKGWMLGETPSEPSMGQALYGTVNVAYRRKGAAVETETSEKPSKPGKYLARFWVDETENFIGLATKSPYKEVEFEIVDPSGGGDVTVTTPVPVPHDWLDAYVAEFGGGDYETAANAKGKNGFTLWESYVAGLNPTDATSQFTAKITMGSDGKPIITWEPDMTKVDPPRTYTTYGKANLGAKTEWTPVTDANRATMHFFKVGVELAK